MPEFVVTLRSGHRTTVRADRVVFQEDLLGGYQFLGLVVDQRPPGGEPAAVTVALFDRKTIVSIVARDHLVSEEKVEPVHVVGGSDDSIPF